MHIIIYTLHFENKIILVLTCLEFNKVAKLNSIKYKNTWYIFQLNFQIESVAIGLIHRPPSWYRLSLTTSMNSHAKIIFLQEDKSRIFLFFNYDQGHQLVTKAQKDHSKFEIQYLKFEIRNSISWLTNGCKDNKLIFFLNN
jgi:hypothetical protein